MGGTLRSPAASTTDRFSSPSEQNARGLYFFRSLRVIGSGLLHLNDVEHNPGWRQRGGERRGYAHAFLYFVVSGTLNRVAR